MIFKTKLSAVTKVRKQRRVNEWIKPNFETKWVAVRAVRFYGT